MYCFSKVVAFLSFAAILFVAGGCGKNSCGKTFPQKKVIYGHGYVRGGGKTTLKNKYAGYVSKVHFYSQARVKKGDVILEYDDYDLRVKIVKAENLIREMEKELERKKLDLEITRIDPLPSDYRNISLKEFAADQLQKRLQHESVAYKRLYSQKCISELDYLRKLEEYKTANADFQRIVRDKNRVASGLDKLYIRIAEKNIEILEQDIQHRKKELELLYEERKYYRIVAPSDGLCITNSDTVHGYNAAGTAAAVVHRDQKRKLIYAYFEQSDAGLIREGMKARFRSNQYGLEHGYFPVTPYEVDNSRTTMGDKCFYLVKFRIDDEHHPLRIDSTGRVEIFPEEE